MSETDKLVSITSSLTFWQTCRAYFELTRLHKFPLGNILLIWPGVWGATMAAYKAQLPFNVLAPQLVLHAAGATMVHSTACVINDICDIDFDRKVERTKHRPLAAGLISVTGAWILLSTMTIGCLALLWLANPVAARVGLIGLFPFHALYPLMKRWTYWPQAWLGLAMNWGFVVAWLQIFPNYTSGDVQFMVVVLAGLVAWTIVYDTEYGCQDRRDDVRAGVKSTAVLFGDHVRAVLIVFAIAFVGALTAAGVMNNQSTVYFAVSCCGTVAHLAWQLVTWEIESREDCGAKFKSNGDLGYIVFAGMLADYALRI
ncbi:4-hydroxybenzoate octaprenyltransferase [Phanerochaete sordida]|uniref:4-hydroxybenzoate polyprenyltransferase, mitochondrial n=1 Tax=Phanerochaete sordida TaxID=48140 RepID=A0A9P3LC34_9APHY|nr:4-hydroxybenzoate octaprenyltransferase [Phanerochaete sordida]